MCNSTKLTDNLIMIALCHYYSLCFAKWTHTYTHNGFKSPQQCIFCLYTLVNPGVFRIYTKTHGEQSASPISVYISFTLCATPSAMFPAPLPPPSIQLQCVCLASLYKIYILFYVYICVHYGIHIINTQLPTPIPL